MHVGVRHAVAMLLVSLVVACSHASHHDPYPLVQANDNRTPAGAQHGDTLELHLAVRMSTWRPQDDSGPSLEVAAFSEEGKPPQIPAPLIRIRTGTTVVATIRNALTDSTIWLHGFLAHPAAADDSVKLRPGDSITVRFAAGDPGTYLYYAGLGRHDEVKDDEREQVAGAFVVDPIGGSPPDRIMVINIWGQAVTKDIYRNALAINGRPWPWDERISAKVGDTLRWRIVNASVRAHPMHLHGFYFDVMSRGNGLSDSVFAPSERRTEVTEHMIDRSTMAMQWIPDRPGDWLFHCHFGFHVVAGDASLEPLADSSHAGMSDDPRQHMAGLVVGIAVTAPPGWHAAARANPRRMRLLIQEGTRRDTLHRRLGFVLQSGDVAPAADSVTVPGTLLVLTRGQPTDITVINHMHEKGAIHWHGIELESSSDGVAGWSGPDSLHATPSIAPGDSFVAHLTLPRAGTFIYHTHMNDVEQLSSGLYGALIVLEPGKPYDAARDHVFIAGWHGPQDPPRWLVNGDSTPSPTEWRAGVTHRIRFINIGIAKRPRFAILRDSTVQPWRALAKDGADLPRALATSQLGPVGVSAGETFDFEWKPEPGEYQLMMWAGIDLKTKPVWVQRILVRR